jgi:hypothetical protein
MAKGIVTNLNIKAATNGFTLSYCVKTKQPLQTGQTYQNTDYKDVDEVFADADKESLLKRIGQMIGVIEAGADEESEGTDVPMLSKE